MVFCKFLHSQNCNDTVYNAFFKIPISYNTVTNSFYTSDSCTIYKGLDYLFKKSKNGNIDWLKKTNYLNNIIERGGSLTTKNNFLSSFNIGGTNPYPYYGLLKIDGDGQKIWAKKITSPPMQPSFFQPQYYCREGKNEDVVAYNINDGYDPYVRVVLLDSNANKKWVKQYNFDYTNPNFSMDDAIVIYGNSSIYIISVISEIVGTFANLNYYLNLIKINYNSGAIISKKMYQCNDVFKFTTTNGLGTYTRKGALFINYNSAMYINSNNSILIADRKEEMYFDQHRFYGMSIDTNLNIKNYKVFKYDSSKYIFFGAGSSAGLSISNNGNAFFCMERRKMSNGYLIRTDTVDFFSFNNSLQKKFEGNQSMSALGLDTSFNFYNNPNAFSSNKFEINYGSQILSGSDTFSCIQQINPALLNINSNCSGVSSNVVIEEEPTISTLPPPNIYLTSFNFILQDYPLVLYDAAMTYTKSCSTTSNCNKLQISGSSLLCSTNSIATFTAHKNTGCYKKIEWQIDTTNITIIDKPNDSSIILKFKIVGSFTVKAKLYNCEVSDSMIVRLISPHLPVNLGADTFLCPNKTIILIAGLGFKNYHWQDGSTTSSYLVKDTGLYHIATTDSCNNITSDSIIIKTVNYNFNIGFDKDLCLYDTASIILPSELSDYKWQPSVTTNLFNNTLKLFPTQTTIYTVNGEIFKGCALEDKILIKVTDCSTRLQIPNVFSPNNDGINDTWQIEKIDNLKILNISIFDRSGQEVFHSKNQQFIWNGLLNNKKLPIGTYYWILEAVGIIDNKNIRYSGSVSILR